MTSKAWNALDEMGRDEIVNKALGAYHEDDEIIDMVARELAEFDPLLTAAMDRIADAKAAVEREKQRAIGLCALRLEADITHAMHERLVRGWIAIVQMALTHARRAGTVPALGEGPRFGEWVALGNDRFVSPCGRVGVARNMKSAQVRFNEFQRYSCKWGYETNSDDARRVVASFDALALYDARFGGGA